MFLPKQRDDNAVYVTGCCYYPWHTWHPGGYPLVRKSANNYSPGKILKISLVILYLTPVTFYQFNQRNVSPWSEILSTLARNDDPGETGGEAGGALKASRGEN